MNKNLTKETFDDKKLNEKILMNKNLTKQKIYRKKNPTKKCI